MDLVTHCLITGICINFHPEVLITGSLVPDLPFYSVYPAWARHTRKTLGNMSQEWPPPPRWLETTHHAFHSVLLLSLFMFLIRLVTGEWLFIQIFLAWGLHILIDIPTHSRKLWGPRFLWPISNFAVNGISWAEILLNIIRKLHHDKSRRNES